MSSLFKSKKESTSQSTSTTNESAQITPFSGEAKANYDNYVGAAANNYGSINSQIGALLDSGGFKSDTTKMDANYNALSGTDMRNISKIATGSVNPYDNADWVAAEKAIKDNAMLDWGSIEDSINRSAIGSGMGGGSGHQTALYKGASDFASQLSADAATRYQNQYNQNVSNALQANQTLQSFYKTLEQMGVDYANLSQSEINTLLSAYTAQNNALTAWGNAVEMGSNPTTTGTTTTNARGKNTTTSSGGMGSAIAQVAAAYFGAK